MKTVREEAIIQLVQQRLNQNKLTSGETIYVTFQNGDVLLVGWCDYEEQKIAAERIVSGTYGVVRVVSQLKIRRLKQSI
ncbi:MAG: BON domain-containing protein [Armatimonadota bacterium]|nr:BON domain-containing protein [bacterium]